MPLKSINMGWKGMNDFGEVSSGLRNRARSLAPDTRQIQEAADVDRRWWEVEDGNRPAARSAPGQPAGSRQPVGGSFNPPPPPPPLNPERFKVAALHSQQSGTQEPKSTAENSVHSYWGPSAAVASTTAIPNHSAFASHSAPASGFVITDDSAGHGTPDGPTAATTAQFNAGAPIQPTAQAGLDALTVQRLEMELVACRDEARALHEMLEDLPEIFERKFRQRLQSILEQQQHLLADNQALREQLHSLTSGAPAVETRPSRLLLPSSLGSMPPLPKRNPLGETLRKVLGLGRPADPGTIDPGRFS